LRGLSGDRFYIPRFFTLHAETFDRLLEPVAFLCPQPRAASVMGLSAGGTDLRLLARRLFA
jgi:hypothetical protein